MDISAASLQVREFVIDHYLFGRDEGLQDGDSFLEAGIIDSTGVLELIAFLESKYGFSVDSAELTPDNLDSIDSVAAYIVKKKTESSQAPKTAAFSKEGR